MLFVLSVSVDMIEERLDPEGKDIDVDCNHGSASDAAGRYAL